jgi:phage repressor protein C with HTH and peptisase S24 domain
MPDDAMAPLLREGDLVGVDLRNVEPFSLRDQIVAAVYQGTTIVRRLVFAQALWILQPDRFGYNPVVIGHDDLRLIGRVVWWVHRET